jgi:hypothetical protein
VAFGFWGFPFDRHERRRTPDVATTGWCGRQALVIVRTRHQPLPKATRVPAEPTNSGGGEPVDAIGDLTESAHRPSPAMRWPKAERTRPHRSDMVPKGDLSEARNCRRGWTNGRLTAFRTRTTLQTAEGCLRRCSFGRAKLEGGRSRTRRRRGLRASPPPIPQPLAAPCGESRHRARPSQLRPSSLGWRVAHAASPRERLRPLCFLQTRLAGSRTRASLGSRTSHRSSRLARSRAEGERAEAGSSLLVPEHISHVSSSVVRRLAAITFVPHGTTETCRNG